MRLKCLSPPTLAILCVPVAIAAVVQIWHTELVPGTVENDFSQFMQQSASWRDVFTVDGFHSLGYAAVLRAVRLATGDPFLAGKIISLAGGLLALVVLQRLVTEHVSPPRATLLTLAVALNWYFFKYLLLAGYTLPLLAISLLAIGAGARACRTRALGPTAWCGALTGLAALFHASALLIALAFVLVATIQVVRRAWPVRLLAVFVAVFALAYAPQSIIATMQKGTPLYSTQAKNVWFGIYGEGWWQSGWHRQVDDVALMDVVRQDPQRFATHWVKETVISILRLPAMIGGFLPPAMMRQMPSPVLWGNLALSAMAWLGGAILAWPLVRKQLPAIRSWRLTAAGWYRLLIAAGWVVATSLAFSAFRFLMVPWVLVWMHGATAVLSERTGQADGRVTVGVGFYLVLLAAGSAVAATALLAR